jgi:hypothetical protein
MRITLRGLAAESDWRDEALRTNLWLIPAIESLAAVALFAVTLSIDEAAFHGQLRLPPWSSAARRTPPGRSCRRWPGH